MKESLSIAARRILETSDAHEKASLSRQTAKNWNAGLIVVTRRLCVSDRPARPNRPTLCAPKDMPKRRAGGTEQSRKALLHALAHIELNAIDLAWDLVARFGCPTLPSEFFDDWIAVADDEARHFLSLCGRLNDFGCAYGDLPAHDGLWQAAQDTANDIVARLAVVPMVLEARGLDVTPMMISRLNEAGDDRSAKVLERIYRDEIRHVRVGRKWFVRLCHERGVDPVRTWQSLVRRHFRGQIKPPFNENARSLAGFPTAYYEPVAASPV